MSFNTRYILCNMATEILTSSPTLAPASSNVLHMSESPVMAARISAVWPVVLGWSTRAPLSSSRPTMARRASTEVVLDASTRAGSLVETAEQALGSVPDESNLRTTCSKMHKTHTLMI